MKKIIMTFIILLAFIFTALVNAGKSYKSNNSSEDIQREFFRGELYNLEPPMSTKEIDRLSLLPIVIIPDGLLELDKDGKPIWTSDFVGITKGYQLALEYKIKSTGNITAPIYDKSKDQ